MNLKHRNDCTLFTYHTKRPTAEGFFDEDDGKIYISSRLGLLTRECVYFHESSHRECFLKKCKCWDNEYWCEYHAMRGEFFKTRATNSIRIRHAYLKNVKETIEKYKQNPKVWGSHLAAIQKLMRTKAFKQFRRWDYWRTK